MRNTDTPIAVEGFPFIGSGLVLAVSLGLAGYQWHPAFLAPAGLCLIFALFSAFFFRNPERCTPDIETAVVAPADGTVIFLGQVTEPHTGAEMEKISIFMSVFNVHVNRAPVNGRVLEDFYTSGKFYDVRHERATFENEQQGLVIEAASGGKLVVVQVAGLIARRIVCYLKSGDQMLRGKRYGLIRFGSRLDVYLPLGSSVKVAMGQKTVAGETVLGILP